MEHVAVDLDVETVRYRYTVNHLAEFDQALVLEPVIELSQLRLFDLDLDHLVDQRQVSDAVEPGSNHGSESHGIRDCLAIRV